MHKAPICFYSSFFQTACNGRWTEAESGHVDLPDDNPAVFEILVYWLYTQKIDDAICYIYSASITMLVRLYVLADKLGIPQLKNMSIDAFVETGETRRKFPSESVVAEVWKTTMPGSPLRQVCVDFWGWDSGPVHYDSPEEAGDLGEFYYRVAKMVAERTPDRQRNKAPFRTNMCQYHEPAVGELCSCGKEGVKQSKLDSGPSSA